VKFVMQYLTQAVVKLPSAGDDAQQRSSHVTWDTVHAIISWKCCKIVTMFILIRALRAGVRPTLDPSAEIF